MLGGVVLGLELRRRQVEGQAWDSSRGWGIL